MSRSRKGHPIESIIMLILIIPALYVAFVINQRLNSTWDEIYPDPTVTVTPAPTPIPLWAVSFQADPTFITGTVEDVDPTTFCDNGSIFIPRGGDLDFYQQVGVQTYTFEASAFSAYDPNNDGWIKTSVGYIQHSLDGWKVICPTEP